MQIGNDQQAFPVNFFVILDIKFEGLSDKNIKPFELLWAPTQIANIKFKKSFCPGNSPWNFIFFFQKILLQILPKPFTFIPKWIYYIKSRFFSRVWP
jgi:hypothetical protein